MTYLRWKGPIVGTIALGLLVAAGMFAAASTLSGPSPVMQAAGPPSRPTHNNNPVPLFKATGGPFIAATEAEAIAAGRAESAIARSETQLLTYGDVIAWTGNRTYTIDPGREVYVVVLSATLQTRGSDTAPPATCLSYTTVIDASTGQVFIVRCGNGTWPSSLPRGFAP